MSDHQVTGAVAEALRNAIGKGQSMILLASGTQMPLEVTAVSGVVVRLRGGLTVQREIAGNVLSTTQPIDFTIALEHIVGVGVLADLPDPTEKKNDLIVPGKG